MVNATLLERTDIGSKAVSADSPFFFHVANCEVNPEKGLSWNDLPLLDRSFRRPAAKTVEE